MLHRERLGHRPRSSLVEGLCSGRGGSPEGRARRFWKAVVVSGAGLEPAPDDGAVPCSIGAG